MIDIETAMAIATEKLAETYESPTVVSSSYCESLEEFDNGTSGWRVRFSVIDPNFGATDRLIEVSDLSEEARLVTMLH